MQLIKTQKADGTSLKHFNTTLNLRKSRCTYGGKYYFLQNEKPERGKGR